MDGKSLYQQISHYDQWKRAMARQLERFELWCRKYGARSSELNHSIRRARQLLSQEDFTLAFVGEFSRGKTELINALLFDKYHQRLLPSTPGRTTMCPTEIYCDKNGADNNRVCLLPIETRRTTASIQSFKRIPDKWVTLEFDPDNPKQVAKAISQVSRTKLVPIETARKLGFDANRYRVIDNQVEIPAWRHALISIDHPLLRRGLRILDTPGLNALGNEPELTLRTLPQAQAVIFLLAADSGVSASDMEIWESHIDVLRKRDNLQVLTLLNKVDTLWDDLIPEVQIDANIRRVREQTAALLRMPLADVIPLSAKQGLLGKATRDGRRLARSNFLPFEQAISAGIVQNRLRIASQPVIADMMTMLDNTRDSLKQQLFQFDSELEQLESSHSPEAQKAVLAELRDNIKQVHGRYHKQALSLRTSQRLLERQLQSLSAPVSSSLLDNQIAEAQQSLAASWTSFGLSRAIGNFYENLSNNLNNLDREADNANRVLTSIYQRKEHKQSSQDLLERHLFNTRDYHVRLEQLSQRANRFRASLDTLLASKSTVISRFINLLVRETREVYRDIERDIDNWVKEALAPLFQQNQYQKQLMEHHMLRLAKLNNEQRTSAERLRELRANIAHSEAALQSLDHILKDIDQVQPPAMPPLPETKVVSLDEARQALQG